MGWLKISATQVAVAFLSVALLQGCGAEPVALLERPIINGDRCNPADNPSAVGVIFEGMVKSSGASITFRALICTGTLIAPDTVLTAAHCINLRDQLKGLFQLEKETYYISFEDDLSKLSGGDPTKAPSGKPEELPSDAREARVWKIHSGFDVNMTGWKGGPAKFNDLGLIFLRSSVSTATPAPLITAAEASQIKKGAKVHIVGWGQSLASSKKESGGYKVCADSVINEVGSHEIQIGSNESSSRQCHGDSGGPAYMRVAGGANGSERVVGVASHLYDKAAGCDKGALDTRVDAYLDWIDKTMKAGCSSGDRDWCVVEGIPPVDQDYSTGEGGCQIGGARAAAPLWLLAFVLFLRRRRTHPGGSGIMVALLMLALGPLAGCWSLCSGDDDNLPCSRYFAFGTSSAHGFELQTLNDSVPRDKLQAALPIPLGQQVLRLKVASAKSFSDGSSYYTYQFIRHVPGASLKAADCGGLQTFTGLQSAVQATLKTGDQVCVLDEVIMSVYCAHVDCDL